MLTRRRARAVCLAVALVVVGSGAAAIGGPSSGPLAGAVTRVEPPAAPNDATIDVTVHTTTPFVQDGATTTVEFVHARTSAQLVVVVPRCAGTGVPTVSPTATPSVAPPATPGPGLVTCLVSREIKARVQLARTDFRGETLLLPPGPYDVYVHLSRAPRASGDMCAGCFNVFQTAPVVITSVSPTQLTPGSTGGPFVVQGYNFSADAVVEAVFAGTNRVDTSIQFTPWRPTPGGAWPRTGSLERFYSVDPAARPGFRDIRVSVPHGRTGRLRRALRIARA